MGLFGWLQHKTDPPPEPRTSSEWHVDPELLRKLIQLEERQNAQERQLKTIDAEWSEWFDKFRHMYARLAKRIKDAAAVGSGDDDARQSGQDGPGSTIPPPPSPGDGQRGARFYGSGRRNY